MALAFLKFLISYDFYSRLGFLISFTVTSLLVLEALRLVYTDANKREVEKLLDSYTKTRNETHPAERRRRIPIDSLEKPAFTPQRRTSSPAVTPDSERTLVHDEAARRQRRHARAQSMAAAGLASPITVTVTQGHQAPHSTTPLNARRLRKRSETVNSVHSSSSSGEASSSRKLERRRRDASPASSRASSKASSHTSVSSGSPSPRPAMRKVLREKDGHHSMNASSLQKLLKQRAYTSSF